MPTVPVAAVLAERMSRQGLTEQTDTDVPAAVTRCAGVQAQDVPAARLAVRSRTTGLRASDVDAAAADGRLARAWLMRSTLHWVATNDLPWLHRLLAPMVLAKSAAVRRQRGITDALLDTSTSIVERALADGPRTRNELVERLADRGVDVPSADNAPAHLFGALAARGVLVRAPDVGRTVAYDRFDRWCAHAPSGPSGEDAVRELVVRYLRAFAPATVQDAATWSGLGVTLLRPAFDALGGATGEHDPAGRELHRIDEPPPRRARTLRLLAGWDTYLMGYRHRSDWLADEHARHVVDGGWLHPAVCVDGRILGRWRLPPRAARIEIDLLPGHRAPARAALVAEVRDIGRFLDQHLQPGDPKELT